MTLAFFAFGLIVGSFLNVLITRWGKESVTGRSKCPRCGVQLQWYDLVPVLSWVWLRARCRACGMRISTVYPLVEIGTGLLFLTIGLAPLPLHIRIFALPIAALLFAIALYDLRTTYIPDAWVWTFNLLALTSAIAFPPYSILHIPYALLAGPIVALPLFALWLFSRGTWMGFGDVKLALGMGWLLGWQSGLLALFLAFLIGALVSAALLFFSSELGTHLLRALTPIVASPQSRWGFTMKSEIPFGPFLIAATLIVWFSDMYSISLPFLAIYGL